MINNRFRILSKIGEGRARVYLCKDIVSGYKYAIKMITPDSSDEERSRFTEEYHTIQKLNHAGIIKAYEQGTVLESEREDIPEGSRYILLEHFEGIELSERKNLTEEELKKIIIQIASVLQYMHQASYIHNDLKPENILISGSTDNPEIKLIDFGFARVLKEKDGVTRGTAEYIAPEILKNEPFDHRADYYSLGMLLYKIIYGKFPFDNTNEIKIFRAQLEDEFLFPDSSYSAEIITVTKRLLNKDPEQRYLYSMQIFSELSFMPPEEIISSWIPARTFCGRRDILNIINNYLLNYNSGEVFIVNGSEGAGKTALLLQLAEKYPGIIHLDNGKNHYGIDLINGLINKVLYNDKIYRSINPQLRRDLKNFTVNPPRNIIDEVKSLFSRIIRFCKFIVVVDDFNYLDEMTLELFREIIPIFQVHNIKIILTENSDRTAQSDFIHNSNHLNLSPFTEVQLQEYFEFSFYNYYPKTELKKTLLSYADLLPGSIESFVKDLLLAGIIRYTNDSIDLIIDQQAISILKESHDYFYKLRRDSLTTEELYIAELLAAHQNLPEIRMISDIINERKNYSESLLTNLRNKNILHVSGDLKTISFTSDGIKEYIYNLINNKPRFHSHTASLIEDYLPGNIKELAYQYESAGEYQKSMYFYRQMYNEALRMEAYHYQKTLLEHLSGFPVTDEEKYKLRFELCSILHKSGDHISALEICNELLLFISDPALLNELLLLKGECLIGSGNPEEGIKQIGHLVDILEDSDRRQSIQAEIASAYLDLNKYNEAENICMQIITANTAGEETIAKCHNLLGIISIHRDNDHDIAYDFFEKGERIYTSAGLKLGTARMQMNRANILLLKEKTEEAENLLMSSLELNSSMGHLKHEANVLMNIGILYQEKLDYVKTVEYFINALSIFSHTGDLGGEGLAKTNLAEIYFLTCEYKKAIESVTEAIQIFRKLQDANEELEAVFLAGKIYSQLGSCIDVERLITQNEKLFAKQGAKHGYNFRFLKLLINQKNLNFFHEIKDIIHYYSVQGDKKNYFLASITAVEFLYDNQLYDEAFELINDNTLKAASVLNRYFTAEWNLYLGLIINQTGNHDDDDHPSSYYLKAYAILEELCISEMTWKTLITLADFYYSRGNTLRAEEHAYFSRTLLEHITEKIGVEALKNFYLDKKEVRAALELCNQILNSNGQ
jgi:serine/threonine protein kinase